MLKSVENEDKAIRLMKDVKSMCQEGGFNLTKFASNSKRVLRSIPEKDRKIGVKNDLLETLPEEGALGVLCNVENDTLGLKVNLKEKPLTKRGVLSVLSSIYDPFGFGAPFLLKRKQIIQKTLNFMAPFYGWGSTASRLEPLRGGSLLFTTKFPEVPGTHSNDLGRMKG